MDKYSSYHRWIAGLTIIALFCITSLSLLFVQQTTHDAHSHHSTTTHTCPFMVHTDTWCPMSALDHVALWSMLTSIYLPTLLIIAVYVTQKLLHHMYVYATYHPSPPDTGFTPTLYIWILHLFSRGILHPKIPYRLVACV